MKTNTHFLSYPAHFFSELKMFRTGVAEKIKTHIVCTNTFFENRAISEITWKHIVQADNPQMTIWRMRIASWIPKARNTLSDYVLLIIFPRWLHERASMLRHTYIACLI